MEWYHPTVLSRQAKTSRKDWPPARYDSSQYGRFMTPDPDNQSGLDHVDDPQSWNGYAYARNNPIVDTDPDGRSYSVCIGDTDGSQHCTTYDKDSDFYQAVHDSPGASFDSGNSGNIYAGGDVVGTFTHSGGNSDTAGGVPDVSGDALTLFGLFSGAKSVASLGKLAFNGLTSLLEGGVEESLSIGSGAQMGAAANIAEVSSLTTKAASTVGNQGAVASSKAIAMKAAEEFVGPGAKTLMDRNTGQVVGEISADGSRQYRITSINKAQPYVNLENRVTGGNLHVKF